MVAFSLLAQPPYCYSRPSQFLDTPFFHQIQCILWPPPAIKKFWSGQRSTIKNCEDLRVDASRRPTLPDGVALPLLPSSAMVREIRPWQSMSAG